MVDDGWVRGCCWQVCYRRTVMGWRWLGCLEAGRFAADVVWPRREGGCVKFRRSRLVVAGGAAGLVLAGCGADDGDVDGITDDEGAAAEDAGDEPAEEPDVDDEPAEEPDDGEPAGDEDGEVDDSPHAYRSLHGEQDPEFDTVDGEVTVTISGFDGSYFPFVVHNGSDELITRVEVTGQVVDSDGDPVGSGSTHGIEPHVLGPDDYAFGYVYGGSDVPDDAELPEPAVDFEEGIGQFENRIQVDVDDVTETGDGFTGEVSNPHDVEVSGPVGVAVACLDGGGQLVEVLTSYTDRDDLEADGGSSTYTVTAFSEVECDALIVGASGYDR